MIARPAIPLALGLTLLALIAPAAPRVRVMLVDGVHIQGRLLGVKGGRVSVRTTTGDRDVKIERVRRIEFPDARAPGPDAATALCKALLAAKPMDALSRVEELARTGRRLLLGRAWDHLAQEARALPAKSDKARAYYVALTALRLYAPRRLSPDDREKTRALRRRFLMDEDLRDLHNEFRRIARERRTLRPGGHRRRARETDP